MKRIYIRPEAHLQIVKEELSILGLSDATTNNGSDNGGSGNSSSNGITLGENDGDAASKQSWNCWDDED